MEDTGRNLAINPNKFPSLFFRSAYFQQIEEDVQKYSNSITALKSSISTFKNKDMNELITYHKYVESILENLADETQVTTVKIVQFGSAL